MVLNSDNPAFPGGYNYRSAKSDRQNGYRPIVGSVPAPLLDMTIEQLHKLTECGLKSDGSQLSSPHPAHLHTCGSYALWNTKYGFYVHLPCHQWSCSVCNPVLAKDLQKRMSQSEVPTWSIPSHVTLTVSMSVDSSIINEAFNDLITYLKRGGSFTYVTHAGHPKTVVLPPRPNLKYVWVNEIQHERYVATGDVVLHKHVIFNQYLTKYDVYPIWNTTLKMQGSGSVFNMVESTHPHNSNSKYLLKYLTKTEYQEYFEKGARRYGCSRGVIPGTPIREPTYLWEFMHLDVARLLAEWYSAESPMERDKIASRLVYDSRRHSPTIYGIVNQRPVVHEPLVGTGS